MFDWVGDAIVKMLKGIAENAVLENVIEKQIGEDHGLFESGGLVETIANSLKPIGFAMCALFFIMALYDLAMQDRFDLEVFMKFFTKLVGGIGVIFFANDFSNLGFGISNWVEERIKNMPLPQDLDKALAQIKEINKAKIGGGLETLFTLGLISLILEIVFAIVSVCITVVCFSRLMEMALRACFMPIALGLISEDGLKGAGGRYIKRFIALSVQGPALLIIARLHSWIISDPLVDFCTGDIGGGGLLASVVPLAGCSFAAVALCFKSVSVINDVFGA